MSTAETDVKRVKNLRRRGATLAGDNLGRSKREKLKMVKTATDANPLGQAPVLEVLRGRKIMLSTCHCAFMIETNKPNLHFASILDISINICNIIQSTYTMIRSHLNSTNIPFKLDANKRQQTTNI